MCFGFLRFRSAKFDSMEDVIDFAQFGDRYIQVKNNEIVDSGNLKGDRVRYIQVTTIRIIRVMGSCRYIKMVNFTVKI